MQDSAVGLFDARFQPSFRGAQFCSPKKSPGFNMPIVASLPFLETTVSLTLPFWI
jgi:hypothetical protein